MTKPQKKLIVVVGPTAVGKTAVAIRLAQFFNTEIISADSRQLFRELGVAAAKPSQEELATVRHHFINSHTIHQPYDAAQYGVEALERIESLFVEHEFLVLCGGSGLYVKAVLEGFDDIPQIPPEIRAALIRDYEEFGISVLQNKLHAIDPPLFQKIDQHNPHRLIRALEVVMGTGQSITAFQGKEHRQLPFQIVKIGLTLPREALYERIDNRMDQMINAGLFKEAEALFPYRQLSSLQTVGYQEVFDFIDGVQDQPETVRLLKRNSRHYAKRQLTWFRRDPDTKWMNPANIDEIIAAVK